MDRIRLGECSSSVQSYDLDQPNSQRPTLKCGNIRGRVSRVAMDQPCPSDQNHGFKDRHFPIRQGPSRWRAEEGNRQKFAFTRTASKAEKLGGIIRSGFREEIASSTRQPGPDKSPFPGCD